MNSNRKSFTRKEYWKRVIISFLAVSIVGSFLLSLLIGGQYASYISALVLLIYWIVLEVRRLNDANKSGLWVLLNLIPIGQFVILIGAGMLESNYVNKKWYSGE